MTNKEVLVNVLIVRNFYVLRLLTMLAGIGYNGQPIRKQREVHHSTRARVGGGDMDSCNPTERLLSNHRQPTTRTSDWRARQ